jgi:hypothetical protein
MQMKRMFYLYIKEHPEHPEERRFMGVMVAHDIEDHEEANPEVGYSEGQVVDIFETASTNEIQLWFSTEMEKIGLKMKEDPIYSKNGFTEPSELFRQVQREFIKLTQAEEWLSKRKNDNSASRPLYLATRSDQIRKINRLINWDAAIEAFKR